MTPLYRRVIPSVNAGMMFPPPSHRSPTARGCCWSQSGGNITVRSPPTVKGAPFRNPGPRLNSSGSIMHSKLLVTSFGAPASDLHTDIEDGLKLPMPMKFAICQSIPAITSPTTYSGEPVSDPSRFPGNMNSSYFVTPGPGSSRHRADFSHAAGAALRFSTTFITGPPAGKTFQ